MSISYKRITYQTRLQIECLLKAKIPLKQIAFQLNYHLSTIYREYTRGLYTHLNGDYTTEKRYSADIAQQKADFNRTTQGAQLKIANDYDFVKFVEKMIVKEKLSPNAVLLYIKKHNLKFRTKVCRATLYNYIYGGVFLNVGAKHLLRKGKMRRKSKNSKISKSLPFGNSIEKRPSSVSSRDIFGHWEMDSIIGKRDGKGDTLLCFTERKTRFEIIFRSDKTARSTVRAINCLERKYGTRLFRHIFKTITCDNGAEFKSDRFEKSPYTHKRRTSLYYCHPYSSWERGSNENQNAFIRRFVPKGTPIETLSNDDIASIQRYINNYPRAIFDGATSQELFANELSNLQKLLK